MTDEEDLDIILNDIEKPMRQWSYQAHGSWLIAKALNNISKRLAETNK